MSRVTEGKEMIDPIHSVDTALVEALVFELFQTESAVDIVAAKLIIITSI